MDDLENKIGSILGNPEMMQKIMALAQNFQMPADDAPPDPPPAENTPFMPDLDLATIQKIAGFAQKSNIDKHQQDLLKALTPYLSEIRIGKLERAMRAAKLANLAGVFFANQPLLGR